MLTTAPAARFGLSARPGTIAAGKSAGLVPLGRGPESGITAFAHPAYTIRAAPPLPPLSPAGRGANSAAVRARIDLTMLPSRFGSFFSTSFCALCLPAALVGGQETSTAPARPAILAPSNAASLHEFSNSLETLSSRVRQAVVQVFSIGYAPVDDSDDNTSGDAIVSKQHSSGSGIILSSDGYLVTNAHVVLGARRIQVKLPVADPTGPHAGRMAMYEAKIDAKLVGLARETDLAVL